MNIVDDNNGKYGILKASKGNKSILVNAADDDAIDLFRNQHGNQDSLISICYYASPDPSAQRVYPLYFCVVSNDLGKARISILEACYYIAENFSISQDCIEVIYNGGNSTAIKPNRGCDHADVDDTNASGASNSAGNHNDTGCGDGDESSKSAKEGASAAEMVILIPPIVYDGQPMPLMPALNYHLARQMADDGVENIDIDLYQQDHFIALSNSINTITDRFVIPLTVKELLYLDANGIAELSKQPRPEDSMILPHRVPEAVEWFAQVHNELQKKRESQKQLFHLLLKDGWQIPDCICKWQRLCVYDNYRLEIYRIIAQFYSWIKASPAEIWRCIQQLDSHNPIRDYHRLKAIITFAVENGGFVGCEHPLLKRFCPAGKCFMAELIDEYEKPYLFEQV